MIYYIDERIGDINMKTVTPAKGQVVKASFDLEKEVVDCITEMEKFTKIPSSTLVLTALKRFISAHKDYLPEDYGKR